MITFAVLSVKLTFTADIKYTFLGHMIKGIIEFWKPVAIVHFRVLRANIKSEVTNNVL